MLALLAPLWPGAALASAGDGQRERWFQPGERFEYNVRWGIFNVGRAIIEVLEPRELDGKPARGFRMTARTNSFADAFYKVRDVNESWTDPDVEGSYLYITDISEGSYRRDFELRFFAHNGTAELWSRETGQHKNTVRIYPGTLDPLSVLFAFRAHPEPLEVGPGSRPAAPDGKQPGLGQPTAFPPETDPPPPGEFDAFCVVPDIRDLGGVFAKSPDAALLIWVTADERRLPVMVKSKVLVGYFTAELVSYRE